MQHQTDGAMQLDAVSKVILFCSFRQLFRLSHIPFFKGLFELTRLSSRTLNLASDAALRTTEKQGRSSVPTCEPPDSIKVLFAFNVNTVYIGFYDQAPSQASGSLNPTVVAKLSKFTLATTR